MSWELHRARRSAVGPRRLASIKRPATARQPQAWSGRVPAAAMPPVGAPAPGWLSPAAACVAFAEVAGAVWARRLGHGPPALALGGPARRADVSFLDPRRWSDCSLLNRARVRAPQIRLRSGKRRMGRLLHMR